MQKMILVTKNNSLRAQILKEAIGNGGHDIITASDPAETINKCEEFQPNHVEEFQPNHVIVDIDIPIKDGYRLSKELKQSPDTKDIKVIIIKSENDPSDKTWAMIKGTDFYVATSNRFKEDTLIEAITSIN